MSRVASTVRLVHEAIERARAADAVELLGRPPHPLLAHGKLPGDLAWPPPREREPFISRGGRFYTQDQLAAQERVEDAGAEWAKAREEGPAGRWPTLGDVDWWGS
jgi:hypothetical protein